MRWPMPTALLCLVALGPAAEGAEARSEIRVATYNVKKGTPAKRIAADLARVKADIVALQEVDRGTRRSGGEDQPALLGKALGMHGHYAASYEVDGGTLGMMVLSRFPLSATGAVALEGSRVLGAVATVDAGGTKIRVYSVHLSATYRASVPHAREARLAREREARRIAELAANEQAPVVVAGDLNAGQGSKPHAELAKVLDDAAARLSERPQPTFPASLPVVRLDHIFASKRLVPIRAEVQRGASDHLMLVVTFQLGE
jgi:endonuclease/exonuclease/phosphatase family metal-dependent hydrolase